MKTWNKLLDGDLEAMIDDYFNSGEARKDMEATQVPYQPGEPIWWYDQLYLTGYAGLPVQAIFVMMGKGKTRNVGIAVKMRNGEWRPKWVKLSNIDVRIAE